MASRGILVVLVAVLVTASWLRLESIDVSWREWLPMLLFALAPILAVGFLRSRLAMFAVLAGSTLFAASAAYEIPLADARPRDPQRDFFGPVLDGIRQGFLDFYETQLPFDRIDFQLMHSLVLLAIFGFTALVGMLVVARRPIPAALGLVFAVGWPATLIPGQRPLLAGMLGLVGVLAILFLLRRDEPPRGVLHAAGVGAVLVLVALVASSTDAVAKPAFLSWQSWDPYDRPTTPVSVEYVWRANYEGIDFPEEPTVVMRVKASGPKRSLYWRATTLDDYTGDIWDEAKEFGDAEQREQIDAIGENSLLPPAAANEDDWIRQDITIEALRDTHLLASAQPVRWRPGTEAPVADDDGDVVIVPDSLRRNQRYTVWSYVPQAKPSQLANFNGEYPAAAERYLEVVYEGVPAWNAEGRDTQMEVFFNATHEGDSKIEALESVYQAALGVTSGSRSPYEAAVLLETWFREAGGFTYDEQPPLPIGGDPPLVDFINNTKRGYCQHYAGAMTLMLRLLGIPSRVAVGFTSGTLRQGRQGVGRQRLQRARVGRGLLPALRLGPVRPDAGPRPARRHVPAELGPVQLRRRRRHRPRRAAERPQPGAPGGLPHRTAGAGRAGHRRGKLGSGTVGDRARPRAEPHPRAPRRHRRRVRRDRRPQGHPPQREVRDARSARARLRVPP